MASKKLRDYTIGEINRAIKSSPIELFLDVDDNENIILRVVNEYDVQLDDLVDLDNLCRLD